MEDLLYLAASTFVRACFDEGQVALDHDALTEALAMLADALCASVEDMDYAFRAVLVDERVMLFDELQAFALRDAVPRSFVDVARDVILAR